MPAWGSEVLHLAKRENDALFSAGALFCHVLLLLTLVRMGHNLVSPPVCVRSPHVEERHQDRGQGSYAQREGEHQGAASNGARLSPLAPILVHPTEEGVTLAPGVTGSVCNYQTPVTERAGPAGASPHALGQARRSSPIERKIHGYETMLFGPSLPDLPFVWR